MPHVACTLCIIAQQSAAVLELLLPPDKAARQIEPFARVHEQLQTNAALQAAQQVIERGTH